MNWCERENIRQEQTHLGVYWGECTQAWENGVQREERGEEGERLPLQVLGKERAKMAHPAFKGCLAHVHRQKTWLHHTLMTVAQAFLAHAHKGFV